jgi:hypothetical protein
MVMKQSFDELAENLATGISRRKALQRFAAGLGAALAAVFTGRPAAAQGNSVCVRWCRDTLGLTGSDLGLCISESAHCPPGQCALGAQTTGFCMPPLD